MEAIQQRSVHSIQHPTLPRLARYDLRKQPFIAYEHFEDSHL